MPMFSEAHVHNRLAIATTSIHCLALVSSPAKPFFFSQRFYPMSLCKAFKAPTTSLRPVPIDCDQDGSASEQDWYDAALDSRRYWLLHPKDQGITRVFSKRVFRVQPLYLEG